MELRWLWMSLSSLWLSIDATPDFSKEKVLAYREKARSMFYHAYNGYLDNAYPLDELKPITCKGQPNSQALH